MTDRGEFGALWSSLTSKSRRRETWYQKSNRLNRERYRKQIARTGRKAELLEHRKHLSLAQGLARYLARQPTSRDDLASELGVSRRSFSNYVNGSRSIPGALLERILQRGDAELHELFGIRSEPKPLEDRYRDAEFSIMLFLECLHAFPKARIGDVHAEAAFAAAKWPHERRKSKGAVQKEADRLMDDLAERYRKEEENST